MDLERHLVKQFVEITNDSGAKTPNTSSYGIVMDVDGTKYVKLDGAEGITPVVSTVSIKDGDRVIVELKNHMATVTGNLDDPSTSGTELKTVEKNVGIKIDELGVKITGLVTFESLGPNGTTSIDGSRITTGTINADRLNLTGAISFNDLTSEFQTTYNGLVEDIVQVQKLASNADDTASEANETVSGWVYQGTTYIDGTMIKTGTVMASKLIGGEVSLLTNAEAEAGGLTIGGSSSSDYTVSLKSNGALAFRAQNGDIDIESKSGGRILLSDNIRCYADTRPSTGAAHTLGTSSYAWKDIYTNNEVTVTSDREAKKEIEYGLSRYNEVFDALKPVSFKYKINDSDRRHIGLISQDVEDALNISGVSTKDFAPFIKSPNQSGGYDYALRYGELIALCVEQIQMLKARVNELENQNGVQ